MNGIKRVAGSLVVTRALGDAYLKKEDYSIMPYAVSVGCIAVARPAVMAVCARP